MIVSELALPIISHITTSVSSKNTSPQIQLLCISTITNFSDPEGRRAQLGQLSGSWGRVGVGSTLPAGLQEGLVQPTRLLCRTESSPALWVTVKNVAGGAPHRAGSEQVVKNQHSLDCRELSLFAGRGKARARLP